MKRVYWRPKKASKPLLLAIGLVAVTGAVLAEHAPRYNGSADRKVQRSAAQLAERSFQAIRDERLRLGHRFVPHLDPGHTGMVGEAMSLTTSLPADLRSKQTSVNPNFAAAVVDMLHEAGVKPGDHVAIGCSGSFPAFNVCVAAAAEAMQLRPTIIHSTLSSQYGANHPEFLWLDMEQALHARGLISFRSAAATLGGHGDRALGTSPETRELLQAAIERNGVTPLHVERLDQSIDARMAIYRQASAGKPIKAYINVGGGAASIRGAKGKDVFAAGLNPSQSVDAGGVDCVASRFAVQGVPVIHLADAVRLAREYDLPIAPQGLPEIGEAGGVSRHEPNRFLAGMVLAVILSTLHVCVWSDFWERMKARARDLVSPRRLAIKGTPVLRPFGAELTV